jgi:hypothetical protein
MPGPNLGLDRTSALGVKTGWKLAETVLGAHPAGWTVPENGTFLLYPLRRVKAGKAR